MYVSYVENPDMTRTITNIPVVVTGETKLNENGFASKPLDTKIDVKIRAKRNMFNDLTAKTMKATIDVSSLSAVGENTVTASLSYPFTSGVTFDRSQLEVRVNVEEYIKKEFEIQPNVAKNPSDGYLTHETVFADGKYIEVSGCKGDIEKIVYISTEKLDLSDLTSDTEKTVTLTAVDANGKKVENVKLSSETAEITFVIYKQQSIPLSLELIGDSTNLDYEISPKEVMVHGPAQVVDALEPINLGRLNTASYTSGGTYSARIPVPSGVELVENEPSEYTVTFTPKN